MFHLRKDFFVSFYVKLSNITQKFQNHLHNEIELNKVFARTPNSMYDSCWNPIECELLMCNVQFSLSFEFLSKYQCLHILWIEQCDSQCIVTNCQSQDRMLIFFSPNTQCIRIKYCRQNNLTNAYSRNEMMRYAFHFVPATQFFLLLFIVSIISTCAISCLHWTWNQNQKRRRRKKFSNWFMGMQQWGDTKLKQRYNSVIVLLKYLVILRHRNHQYQQQLNDEPKERINNNTIIMRFFVHRYHVRTQIRMQWALFTR